MIDFKDFLVTNPGMEKDDHKAYMAQKRKRRDCEEETVKEKLTAAQLKKRLDMIRKSVEKINAKNAEKAKKDALKHFKDMDF